MARVTFPRVKYLARLLSLLNFSSDAVTKLFTCSLSRLAYVGQSGHAWDSRAAGTVEGGGQIREG